MRKPKKSKVADNKKNVFQKLSCNNFPTKNSTGGVRGGAGGFNGHFIQRALAKENLFTGGRCTNTCAVLNPLFDKLF